MSSDDGRETDSQADRSQDRLPLSRRNYLQVTGAAAVGSFTATGSAAAQSGDGENSRNATDENPQVPTDLRVEYAQNPLGIDTERPRFSWNLVSEQRELSQTAYRILVASSRDALDSNTGEVWDSGRVKTSQSTQVEYDGSPLEPTQRYHWKVRIWGTDGDASDWSDPACYEMGLIDDDEWKAEWIGSKNLGNRPGIEWTDYTFETDFIIKKWAAGFIFRAQDTDNLYMWQINTRRGPPVRLRPHVREKGEWRTLDPVSLDNVLGGSAHDWHHLTIDLQGNKIITHIDGQRVDLRTDTTYTAGTIGFRQDGSEHAQFDNVSISSLSGRGLFEDNFSSDSIRNFTDGSITDGTLDVQDEGIILRGGEFSHPSPLLRNEVILEKKVAEARAYISGLGFYRLYLNGERVGDRVLDPGQTDYQKTVLYATHDITDSLQLGSNAIGVALGRGRYGELLADTFNWASAPWWSDPELRIQINIRFVDGTTTVIGSDETWTVTDGPVRFDSLYGGEIYDAREEKSGWTTPGYDDSNWQDTLNVGGPSGELNSQQVQPIRVDSTIKPIEITEPESDIYVYDFGQMMAGWTELTVEGSAGTKVKMSLGEKLKPDGTVYNKNSHIPGKMQVDQYILEGKGTETWAPEFIYNGFRYVQLEGFPGTPTLDNMEAKVAHSAVDDSIENSFSCSDDLLTQIHENTRWAMLNNMFSFPTDTPAREKNPYGADAQVVAEAAIYNFSMPRFYTKWLRDWSDSQRSNGRLPTTAPNAGDWTYDQGGPVTPCWGSAYVLIPWWMYNYYADKNILEEHYKGMKKYVQRMNEISNNYIIKSGLGDWNAPGGSAPPPEGPAITSTGYFYHDAKILSEIARILKREEDTVEFDKLSEKIKVAFNNEFLGSDNVYQTGTASEYRQTSNVFPLAVGLVPDERQKAVVENLVEDIMVHHNGHLNTGATGTKYLLQVLTEYGHLDVAYTIATRTTYPSWGYWIEAFDATALFERWDESRGIFSRDHQYFGSIDEWFYQYLAGIKEPVEPGFKHIEIAPELPGDLKQASGTVETVRGAITSSWKQTSNGLTLNVTIPGNAIATVRIPALDSDKVRIRENGKNIWNNGNQTGSNPGIRQRQRDGDRIVVEVGSGEYQFELEQLGKTRK